MNLKETNVADDVGAYVVVEFLGNAFVLHHEILPKRSTRELNLQLTLFHEDLLGVAHDGFAHHLRPSLRDAILEQRCL